MAVLGVDVGGTFTDAVVLDGGHVTTAKVLTAPHEEESVLAAVRAAGAERVKRFAHGTTAATNALLERKAARTAPVTTAGFEHLLHLRRQTRARLYRPCAAWPEPLVPLERSHGVRGRMGPDGELEPLDLGTLPDVDAEAVAVCLLHAYRDPSHERAVVEELRGRLPGANVGGRVLGRGWACRAGERTNGRRPSDPPPDRRSAHRGCRRRLARLDGCGWCASCRAAERWGEPRPSVLRARRDAGHCHRREPLARTAPPTARRRRRARPPRCRTRARGNRSGGSRRRRQRRDAARAASRFGRARS